MRKWPTASLILLALCACAPTDTATPEREAARTSSDAKVLAWVDGRPIREDDVARSIMDNLGADAVGKLPADARRAVLESLVISRAMANKAQKTLDAEALSAIDAKVQARREVLLVKRYLRDNANPGPVTEAMIQEYYNAHPEQFGGGEETTIELVRGGETARSDRRAELLAAIGEFARQPDWERYAEGLSARGLDVTYSRSVFRPDIFDKRLVRAVERLGQGEISDTLMLDGRPHVVRVVAVERRSPQPLAQIRADVRKALLPRQVKKAINQVSERILADADIRYVGDSADGDE